MLFRGYIWLVFLVLATGCATHPTSQTPAQNLTVAPRSMTADYDRFVIPTNIPRGSFVDVSTIVCSRDTPAKIAERVGVTVNDLKALNPCADFDRLRVGQMIVIYTGSVQGYVTRRPSNKVPDSKAAAY